MSFNPRFSGGFAAQLPTKVFKLAAGQQVVGYVRLRTDEALTIQSEAEINKAIILVWKKRVRQFLHQTPHSPINGVIQLCPDILDVVGDSVSVVMEYNIPVQDNGQGTITYKGRVYQVTHVAGDFFAGPLELRCISPVDEFDVNANNITALTGVLRTRLQYGDGAPNPSATTEAVPPIKSGITTEDMINQVNSGASGSNTPLDKAHAALGAWLTHAQ